VTPKIWIDVEDLFEYTLRNPRPSGIQRLAFEIYRAIQSRPDAAETVRFVRHQHARNSFRVVQWREIEALFVTMTETPRGQSNAPSRLEVGGHFGEARDSGPILPHTPLRQFVRKLVHRLPPLIRIRVITVMLTQATALRAWGALIGFLAREAVSWVAGIFHARSPANATPSDATVAPPVGGRYPAASDEEADEIFANTSAAGDILLVLGSPWSHPDYASLVEPQRRRGLKFGLLVYDLIPIRRPEWCDRNLVRYFRAWFDGVFPLCDEVFAISQSTARDVEAYARESGVSLRGPVRAIPVGTVFEHSELQATTPNPRPLPAAGTYALFVSTIEPRKNHMLLFRAWRKLLEERPRDTVPTLVFAGRVGWSVDDLMRQISNTDCLGGKLKLIEDPTDTELLELYRGCLFTLFPSFCEGWGLPVTESLYFGKPCLTSNATSLPEAGGGMTRLFDPDNLGDAYAAILDVIDDRAGLARWEAQIRRDFKLVPWSATADALFTQLGFPSAPSIESADALAPLVALNAQ